MKKSEVVQIRLTKEQKELFKEVAKELETNMSELMIVATEKTVKRYKEKMSLQEELTDRAIQTEKKLSVITDRIRRKNYSKKDTKKRRFIFWV